MKISKKILAAFSVVAMLTMAFSFTGCKDEEDDQGAIDGDKISFTHDGTSGEYYRAFSTTSTKHYSSTAKITINNATTITNSSNNANCALGYVFGLKEIDVEAGTVLKKEDGSTYTVTSDGLKTAAENGKTPKFYTFGVVGIRYNKSGTAQWYVSWCENVPNSVFSYNNSSAFSADLYAGTTKVSGIGYETQIIPTSGSWSDFTASLTDAKALSVTVKSVANDDGSYTINLLDAAGTSTIKTQNVSASVTGLSAKTQLKLGKYTTVYKGETASGTIKLEDVSGAAVVIEE